MAEPKEKKIKEAKIKEPKPLKKAIWISFSEDQYRKFIDTGLMHHSNKLVNSNAAAGGVRLSGCAPVDLPYVSVSTVVADNINLDFINDAKNNTMYRQIIGVVRNTAEDVYEVVPGDEATWIKDAYAQLSYKALPAQDCRLKRLIMPNEQGEDAVLIPLHSAGLAESIHHQIDRSVNKFVETKMTEDNKEDEGDASLTEAERREQKAKNLQRFAKRPFNHASMMFGGTRPANIGGLNRYVREPLWFSAPQENHQYKEAMSIYYKGVNFISRDLIEAFLDWRDRCQVVLANDSSDATKATIKNSEKMKLREIIDYALSAGESARELIIESQKQIGATENIFYSKDVPDLKKKLINPAERTSAWTSAFCAELAKAIADHKRWRNEEGEWIEIDACIDSREEKRIEKELRAGMLS